MIEKNLESLTATALLRHSSFRLLVMLRKAQQRCSSAGIARPPSSSSRGDVRLESGPTWVLFLVHIPRYDFVVAACLNGSVRVFKGDTTGKPFKTFTHHTFCVNGMVLLHDDILASVDTGGSLLTWKASTGEILGRIKIYGDFMGPVSKLSPSLLAIGKGNNNIVLVHHELGRNLGEYSSLNNNDNNPILNMDSFNEILVTVSSLNNRTCIWNYCKEILLVNFVHPSLARSVIINRSYLIIGCDDGKVYIRRNDPKHKSFPVLSIISLATITGTTPGKVELDHQMTLAFITEDLFMANTKTKGIIFISLVANNFVYYLKPEDAYGGGNKLISAIVLNDNRICVGGNGFCRIIKPPPKLATIIQESQRKYGKTPSPVSKAVKILPAKPFIPNQAAVVHGTGQLYIKNFVKPDISRLGIRTRSHGIALPKGASMVVPAGPRPNAEIRTRGELLKRRNTVDATGGGAAKRAKLDKQSEKRTVEQLENIVASQGKELGKMKEELERTRIIVQHNADLLNSQIEARKKKDCNIENVLKCQNSEIDKIKSMAPAPKRKYAAKSKEAEEMQKNLAQLKKTLQAQKELLDNNQKNSKEWDKWKAEFVNINANLLEKLKRMEELKKEIGKVNGMVGKQDESIKLVATAQKMFSENKMQETEKFQHICELLNAKISNMKAAIEAQGKAHEDERKEREAYRLLIDAQKEQVEKLETDVEREMEGRKKEFEELQKARAAQWKQVDEMKGMLEREMDLVKVNLDRKKLVCDENRDEIESLKLKVEETRVKVEVENEQAAVPNWKEELDKVKTEFAEEMKKTQGELEEQRDSVSFLKNVVNMLVKR